MGKKNTKPSEVAVAHLTEAMPAANAEDMSLASTTQDLSSTATSSPSARGFFGLQARPVQSAQPPTEISLSPDTFVLFLAMVQAMDKHNQIEAAKFNLEVAKFELEAAKRKQEEQELEAAKLQLEQSEKHFEEEIKNSLYT